MKKEAFKPTQKSLATIASMLIEYRWYCTCKCKEAITESEAKKFDRLHDAANLLCETIIKDEFHGDADEAINIAIKK